MQEAVGRERVEVGLIDLGLLLEEAVEQADLGHGEWHELFGLGGDEVVGPGGVDDGERAAAEGEATGEGGDAG